MQLVREDTNQGERMPTLTAFQTLSEFLYKLTGVRNKYLRVSLRPPRLPGESF